MARTGYILAIDGLRYLLTTSGVTAGGNPTSANADWFGPDTSRGGTFLDGFLDEAHLEVRWSERARTTGELTASSMSFPLHDAPVDAAPFNGANVATYLLTRNEDLIASTQLASPVLASDTTIDVLDASVFTVPGPAWIEREAVLIASVTHHSGYDTLNLTSRGYYGTRAIAHTIDLSQNYQPEVFVDYPWTERRRCILWIVTVPVGGTVGTAAPLWRGYLSLAPQLADDGARFTLEAEHVWPGMYAQTPAGDPRTIAITTGYNRFGFGISVRKADNNATPPRYGSTAASGPVYTDADSAWAEACRHASYASDYQFSVTGSSITAARDGSGFRISASISGIGAFGLIVSVGDTTVSTISNSTSDPHYAEIWVGPTPGAMVVFDPFATNTATPGHVPNKIQVRYALGLPAAWTQPTGSPWTDATTLGTTIAPVLRGALSDDQWLVLVPSTTDYTDASGDATLTSEVKILPRKPTGQVETFTTTVGGISTNATYAFIPGAVQLHYAARVTCDHWAFGLQHAISDPDVTRSQVDPRDWDFSTVPAVVDATLAASSARDWFFDGSSTWNDIIKESVSLDACALALRDSRMAFVSIGPPTQGSIAAATITTADFVEGQRPKFSRAVDELITGVQVNADGLNLLVNNATAIGRYGKGQVPDVTLDGIALARLAAGDPVAFAQQVFHRITAWGKPLALVKIPVSPDVWLRSVFIGDYIDVSEWLLPTGAGSRGLGNAAALALLGVSTQRVQIIGRDVDLTGSPRILWLEGILWGAYVSGYAPCVRVSLIAGNLLTIAGPGYANGSDYAGSNEAGYPGSVNDGGVTYFQVGDAVELIQRDTNSYVSFTSTITAISLAGPNITLAASPPASSPNWPSLATNGTVDLRPDHYAACGANQRRYAYVGSASPPYHIDGTSDVARRFAP